MKQYKCTIQLKKEKKKRGRDFKLFTSDWEDCVCWCRHGNHCRIPTRVAGFLQKPRSVIASFLLLDAASRDKCQSSLFFFSSLLLNIGNDSAIKRESMLENKRQDDRHISRRIAAFQPEKEYLHILLYDLWSLWLNFRVLLSNMKHYITKIFLLQLKP